MKESFGMDLNVEFFAPRALLAKGNLAGMTRFFRELVEAIDMQVICRPFWGRLPLPGFVRRWLSRPTFYWITGQGGDIDGVTAILPIQTSRIDLHTWPEIGQMGYGRLGIATCKPASISAEKVVSLLERYFLADVFWVEAIPWKGPKRKPDAVPVHFA